MDRLLEIEMMLKKHIREQNLHNASMKTFCANQEVVNTTVTDTLAELKRGVHGDPANEVAGLIARQKKSEESIKIIKTKQQRLSWYAAGVVVGLNTAIYFIKELLHK